MATLTRPTNPPTEATAATDRTGSTPAIDWREVVRWAALGVLVLVMVVLVDIHRNGGNNPVSLIQPGIQGPATQLFEQDFPTIEQPDSRGLDGQMYYAIARDPIHLDETSEHLDGPRYRFQRPLLSWAAWALHPTGGGLPLVYALVVVVLAGVLLGAVATGALSQTLRGPAWLAALFPVLPGAYWSLRVTVSDALALGLALTAVALAARSRHAPAIAVGVLAVLAKEPAILVLVGWALWRRNRRDALLVVVPALVIVTWMAWLHIQLPDGTTQSRDLGLPLEGLVDAWRLQWSHGQELVGMACTVGGLVIGGAALAVRGLRHPLGWTVAVQLGFMLAMQVNPTAMNFGGTRMAMPVMVLGGIALLTPHAASAGGGGAAVWSPPWAPTLRRRPVPKPA